MQLGPQENVLGCQDDAEPAAVYVFPVNIQYSYSNLGEGV